MKSKSWSLKSWSLLSCLAVFLLALGFTLPGLVAGVQDSYIENQVSSYELPGIELDSTGNGDMGPLLSIGGRLDSYGRISVKYNEGQRGQVTDDMFRFFDFFDTVLENEIDWIPFVEDYFLLMQGGTTVGSYWLGSMHNGEIGEDSWSGLFLLENETRKVMAFTVKADEPNAYLWAEALQNYYGFTDCRVGLLSTENDIHNYVLTFHHVSRESITTATAFLSWSDGWLNFNRPSMPQP